MSLLPAQAMAVSGGIALSTWHTSEADATAFIKRINQAQRKTPLPPKHSKLCFSNRCKLTRFISNNCNFQL